MIDMRAVVTSWCVVFAMLGLSAQVRTGTLTIHYIDTEGGQSTLFVGPTGESLLVDTGNAGDRDLGRIAETLRAAGVTNIDHVWTTHYHGDHVGALIELAKQFPVGHFYDHGKPHANDRIVSSQFLSAYESLSAGKRTIVKPGDKVKARCHPLRDGSRGCLLGFVKARDGSVKDWDGNNLPIPADF